MIIRHLLYYTDLLVILYICALTVPAVPFLIIDIFYQYDFTFFTEFTGHCITCVLVDTWFNRAPFSILKKESATQ
jgi:hypothetical protein